MRMWELPLFVGFVVGLITSVIILHEPTMDPMDIRTLNNTCQAVQTIDKELLPLMRETSPDATTVQRINGLRWDRLEMASSYNEIAEQHDPEKIYFAARLPVRMQVDLSSAATPMTDCLIED